MAERESCFVPIKVNAGKGALAHLPFELNALGAGRPLVLLGGRQRLAGFDKILAAACGGSGMTLGFCEGMDSLPTLESLRDLARLYRDRGFDALVALGGGPVADTAKVLNIAVSGAPEDLARAAGPAGVGRRLRPFVYLPTLTETGAEMTRHARSAAAAYDDPFLMPDLVFADPRLLGDAPPSSVVASALVSLVHAAESYVLPTANPFVEAYAAAAVALLRDHLLPALEAGSKAVHRLALANAAVFAAGAFSNGPPGMAHCLGEALAAETEAPAGVLMGLLLPAVLSRMAGDGADLSRLLLPAAGMEGFARAPARNAGGEAAACLAGLVAEALKKTGLAVRTLAGTDLSRETGERVARAVPAGAPWSEEDALAVVRQAWGG